MTMKKDERILQLKITLDGIQPPIWRRFLTKDSINFKQLHKIIQTVMGWQDDHLYEFNIGNVSITPSDDGYNLAESSFHALFKSPECFKLIEKAKQTGKKIDLSAMNDLLRKADKNRSKTDSNLKTPISTLLNSENLKFDYTYDFGDCWKHQVIVEKIIVPEAERSYPFCIDGKRNCPPEDCGSIPGYYELMKIRQNKNHPDYQERIVEWLGEGYDPELFIIDWVNASLQGRKAKAVWIKK